MADIAIASDGPIVTIRLSRPGKKNALTDAMSREIADSLMAADADRQVRAVMILAEGPDFCAGNDLALIQDMAAGKIKVEDLCVDHFLGALSSFSKPLLAGVKGRAIGVGATMLLHCDAVCVARDATISFPFVDLSLVPEAAATYLVPHRIGYARAYRLLCLAEPLSGDDAVAIGLFTIAEDAGEVDSATARMAQRLADKPSGALQATKRLMKDRVAIDAALARDKAAFLERLGSFDRTKVKTADRSVPAYQTQGTAI